MKKKIDFTVPVPRKPWNRWAWFWGIGFLFVSLSFVGESYWITKTWLALRTYMKMGYTRAVWNILNGGGLEQGSPVSPNGPENPNQYQPHEDTDG